MAAYDFDVAVFRVRRGGEWFEFTVRSHGEPSVLHSGAYGPDRDEAIEAGLGMVATAFQCLMDGRGGLE